ncbi:MAG: dihydropteroate synthase [Gemmataceae bacterium]
MLPVVSVAPTAWSWTIRDRVLDLRPRALVMGIVNVTPDSFSDGGRYFDPHRAIEHARQLIREGADLLDIGGESTRPGATPVAVDEEIRRVVPVIKALAGSVPLSIDTMKAAVAEAALQAGAQIVNDVTALGDPAMPEVVRRFQAGLVLMHMRGTPQTMAQLTDYVDVVTEVRDHLQSRLLWASKQGIDEARVVVDPGIGFAKRSWHNWTLLARLGELAQLGRPVLLGVSRKGFLGKIGNRSEEQRLPASLACACDAVSRQTARIIRVHDVEATRYALDVLAAIQQGGTELAGAPDPAL